MEWAYNVYYKSNKKGKKFHVLYAVRVAFPQKTIHMGSHHTNRPAVKVCRN
jgi:hypothetical protein